jgi:hypothetical protein
VDFETKDLWNELLWCLGGSQNRESLEQEVRESCPEIRSIDAGLSRGPCIVQIFTARTIELDSIDSGDVC